MFQDSGRSVRSILESQVGRSCAVRIVGGTLLSRIAFEKFPTMRQLDSLARGAISAHKLHSGGGKLVGCYKC